MENFEFVSPTHFVFGRGVENEVGAKLADAGARRVELRLPYGKGGLLDQLYREAKVEKVEYGEAIRVTAVCTPRTLGQLADYLAEG